MPPNEKGRKQDAMQATSDHIDTTTPVGENDFASDKDVDGNGFDMSEEEFVATEKSLVRKLDLTLVPVVWILYLFNYLDRNNIAYVNFLTRYVWSQTSKRLFGTDKHGLALSKRT